MKSHKLLLLKRRKSCLGHWSWNRTHFWLLLRWTSDCVCSLVSVWVVMSFC